MEVKALKSSILPAIGKIKWTNKYDCPTGYEYNKDGYVITKEAYPKLAVIFLPHMLRTLSVGELLYYNLLVLYVLNPNKPYSILLNAAVNRMKQAFGGMAIVDDDTLEEVTTEFKRFEGNVIEELPTEFCRMDTIWYSSECKTQHVSTIRYLIKEEAIDKTRDTMAISTKYKTKDVSEMSGYSKHIVRKYWKKRGLDERMRILNTVSEALTYLGEQGIDDPTQQQIAEVAGMTRKTIANNIKLLKG